MFDAETMGAIIALLAAMQVRQGNEKNIYST